MRIKNLVTAISALALTLTLGSTHGICQEKQDLKLGVIIPLSGENSSLGRYLKNAIALAYSMRQQDEQQRIKLFEDDQLQSAKSVAAFQKLRSLNQVDVVFAMGSGVGNALAPLSERAKIPFVAIGASDGGVARGRKYAFTHWVMPETEAKVMAAELKRRDYKRLALIGAEHEGVEAVYNALEPELKSLNLFSRVKLDKRYQPNEKDFKTFLAKARADQVDATIVLLFPGALAAFAKQAKALYPEMDLAGVELFEDQSEVEASGGALIGQWYVNADSASPQFAKAYRQKYSSHPGWATANAFDAFNIVADAFVKLGSDADKIAHYLETLSDYNGAAGVYSATDDHRFHLPATLKIVKEDGFAKLFE